MTALNAAAIAAAAIASYFVASGLVPTPARFAVAQIVLAIAAAIGVRLALPRGVALRTALGLRRAPWRMVAAAIAIGATTWYVNAWLVDVLMRTLPVPKGQLAQLQGLVDRPPLAVALAQFALLPAVCEEIVFRGVLARSLGRRRSLAAAAAISAVAFSAYHLSAVQALPTLTLGVALGVLAIRADSIAPTMIAHALNNAMAIAMSRGQFPAVSAWLGGHPAIGVAACSAATAGGLALALRRRR